MIELHGYGLWYMGGARRDVGGGGDRIRSVVVLLVWEVSLGSMFRCWKCETPAVGQGQPTG